MGMSEKPIDAMSSVDIFDSVGHPRATPSGVCNRRDDGEDA
jgi:hypothetical protein